jgi:phosphatidate cytidylyltransferase
VIALPRRQTQTGGDGWWAGAGARNLLLRIASAAVLAPIVLACAYLGGWYFLLLCALGAVGIFWEWTRLIIGRSEPRVLAPATVALLAAAASAGLGDAAAAGIAIALGAALAGIAGGFGIAGSTGLNQQARWIWAAGGVVYAGAALLGPALLRRDPEFGFRAFLFLAATVWLTDIGAYAVGRAVRGPLLWPQISPNKTWSGLFGGLAVGVAGGTVVAYASGIGRLEAVAVIALVLSALAQAGDLLESAIKRRFGAKDTSRLIPGHGGLMDRLDGFLVAALVALLIGLYHQGINAPARGLLVW